MIAWSQLTPLGQKKVDKPSSEQKVSWTHSTQVGRWGIEFWLGENIRRLAKPISMSDTNAFIFVIFEYKPWILTIKFDHFSQFWSSVCVISNYNFINEASTTVYSMHGQYRKFRHTIQTWSDRSSGHTSFNLNRCIRIITLNFEILKYQPLK